MSDSTNSVNPLTKHFRQPILHLRLPSKGKWWANGSLELPVTNEIPVYAMTARDEITMKTPDALMNGSSTVSVIQSCCPSIANAWDMPTVDLDPILIAIRIATYGPEMEFTAICPHCQTINEQGIDLSVMLSRVKLGEWDTPIKIDGLTIKLKPQTYQDFNSGSLLSFEEQRLIQLTQDDSLSEEVRKAKVDELFDKIINNGITQLSKSISEIITEDGVSVTNQSYIIEFLNNCDRRIWEALKNQLETINSQSSFTTVTLTCTNEDCGKEFVTPFTFEQSSFFG